MNRTKLHFVVFFACVALWTTALLLPVPHESASQALGGDEGIFLFGKTLHVCAYAFLTILGGSMPLQRQQRWLLLGGLSLHGFVTEFLQLFVERGASFRDVGLDHLGIAIGIGLGWRWWRGLLPRPAESAL